MRQLLRLLLRKHLSCFFSTWRGRSPVTVKVCIALSVSYQIQTNRTALPLFLFYCILEQHCFLLFFELLCLWLVSAEGTTCSENKGFCRWPMYDSPRINSLNWYLCFTFIIFKESRQHLFPTMFARLYLVKALQQVSNFQFQAASSNHPSWLPNILMLVPLSYSDDFLHSHYLFAWQCVDYCKEKLHVYYMAAISCKL